MSHFIAAYLVVWLGLLAYVLRLGVQQRRLARTLDALERTWNPGEQHADRPDPLAGHESRGLT
jgi:CcmD family protein